MADFTQAKSTIISHQAVTNPASVEGTAVSVAASISGLIICRHAYVESVDSTDDTPVFDVMGSVDASGDEGWFKIVSFKCVDTTATIITEAMTATEPTAETSLACASTTGFNSGDEIYVQDASVVTDGEWHLIESVVANTSVEIFYGLTTGKDSADVMWGHAQTFRISLDLSGLSRVNVVYRNEFATGTNTHVLVELLQSTDIE